MKITKRHSSAVLRPASEREVTPIAVGFRRDATTDTELYSTEAMLADFEQEGAIGDAPYSSPFDAANEAPVTFPKIALVRPEMLQTSKRTHSLKAPSGWPVYLAALFVSVLWAGAPIAFAYGYRVAKSPFDFDPFVMLVLGAMAVGPAALVWIAAYMIQQGRRLSAEAKRAKAVTDEMIAPALAAGLQAHAIAQSIRQEIASAGDAAQEAKVTLQALRAALTDESDRLMAASAYSAKAASDLTLSLSTERAGMVDLAQTLEARAGAIAAAIAQQTKRVTDASDLAEAQMREAEALLTARTADLTTAAGAAGDAARISGDDLARHIARLEMAGLGVAEQISAVDKGLGEQRSSLVTITHALRADQELFAAQSESHSAQLTDFISQARSSTEEMGERATQGGEALQELISAATLQFRELAAAAKAERDAFGASTLQAMGTVATAAAEERARLEVQTREAIEALTAAAEKTRAAADRHSETARQQVDQLSEAAFSAGQKANRVFETRLTEAQALIERSADMVEQAGAATARKLEEGAAAAREAFDDLGQMFSAIEQRAARLPAAARGQADQVRLAMTEGMDELMDQARRTARETQAIDAAFQDRVRRNYEMLTDAVRLMGSVAGAAGSLAPSNTDEVTPPKEPRALKVRSARAVVPPVVEETPKAPRPATKRTRLKLTPTASDAEFSKVFEEAAGRSPKPVKASTDSEGWTWKDLLTSLDSKELPAEAKPLDTSLLDDIDDLGLDPVALLPDHRIEQIAATIEAEDIEGARAVVRKLAPAATRRLARQLSEDKTFRRRVLGFVGQYQDRLADTLDTNPEAIDAMLSSDLGRAYLLLEAASADLV